ncbi:MAG: DUF2505 domain-containing protein [Oceanococcus sp.]
MNFEEKYNYDKDADTVFRMFIDKTYFERKYAATTSSFEVLEHSLDDAKFQIKVRRVMPSDAPVPGFAKKFLPGEMTVVQEDTWDLATHTGQIKIEIAGAPVSVSADMRLIDGSQGAENHVSWSIDCNIPLVGKKIAKFVADDIQAKSPADLRLSNEILQEY